MLIEGKDESTRMSFNKDQCDQTYLAAHYRSLCSLFFFSWSGSLHISSESKEVVHLDWRARMSLYMLRLFRFFAQPLKHLGRWTERTINLIYSNGGFFNTLYTLATKRHDLVILPEDSHKYLSIIGYIDERIDLLQKHPDFANTCPDSKTIADMCAMASKLAYENPACIKHVVEQIWNMHLVGTYNCWNEYQKKNSTQAFIFTDRAEDCHAIVLGFRGTEPFNSYDWCTDFDFSWYELPQLGRVHLGFLEALGLGDRTKMETFERMKANIYENTRTPAPSTPTSGLKFDETKLLAYDHLSMEIISLLKQNPKAKLYITGHSLGGALAMLFTGMLFYYREENRLSFYGETKDDATNRIAAVYTFGQPRVGDCKFAEFMDANLERRCFRIVYNSDMVARVPFDNNLFGFKHCGRCYFFDYTYDLRILQHEPNPNYYSPIYFILGRVHGALELLQSLFFSQIYGEEYRESLLSSLLRLVGLILPGPVGHSLVNYVNCVRLGPEHLDPMCRNFL